MRVACALQLHRQPVTWARMGDMPRLFDVIDTPGFIPVHPGKGKSKRRLSLSLQQQLQQRLGTGARQGQLELGIFFDFTHPHPSPDELALLGAFHMLPHSCLFTIEEAAVALGNAFFRIRKLLPAASDLDRVMSRYKMDQCAFKEDMNMGVQLLLTVSGGGERSGWKVGWTMRYPKCYMFPCNCMRGALRGALDGPEE